jgi:hypothetical protein
MSFSYANPQLSGQLFGSLTGNASVNVSTTDNAPQLSFPIQSSTGVSNNQAPPGSANLVFSTIPGNVAIGASTFVPQLGIQPSLFLPFMVNSALSGNVDPTIQAQTSQFLPQTQQLQPSLFLPQVNMTSMAVSNQSLLQDTVVSLPHSATPAGDEDFEFGDFERASNVSPSAASVSELTVTTPQSISKTPSDPQTKLTDNSQQVTVTSSSLPHVTLVSSQSLSLASSTSTERVTTQTLSKSISDPLLSVPSPSFVSSTSTASTVNDVVSVNTNITPSASFDPIIQTPNTNATIPPNSSVSLKLADSETNKLNFSSNVPRLATLSSELEQAAKSSSDSPTNINVTKKFNSLLEESLEVFYTTIDQAFTKTSNAQEPFSSSTQQSKEDEMTDFVSANETLRSASSPSDDWQTFATIPHPMQSSTPPTPTVAIPSLVPITATTSAPPKESIQFEFFDLSNLQSISETKTATPLRATTTAPVTAPEARPRYMKAHHHPLPPPLPDDTPNIPTAKKKMSTAAAKNLPSAPSKRPTPKTAVALKKNPTPSPTPTPTPTSTSKISQAFILGTVATSTDSNERPLRRQMKSHHHPLPPPLSESPPQSATKSNAPTVAAAAKNATEQRQKPNDVVNKKLQTESAHGDSKPKPKPLPKPKTHTDRDTSPSLEEPNVTVAVDTSLQPTKSADSAKKVVELKSQILDLYKMAPTTTQREAKDSTANSLKDIKKIESISNIATLASTATITANDLGAPTASQLPLSSNKEQQSVHQQIELEQKPSFETKEERLIQELERKFLTLVQEERYQEAFDCKQQIETLKEIVKLEQNEMLAKQQNKTSEEIEIRIKIEETKRKLFPEERITKWKRESTDPTHMTFAQMKAKLLNTVGSEKAEAFLIRYGQSSERFSNISSFEDLQKAIVEQQNAKRMMNTILGGKALSTADVTAQHVYRWQQILDKCCDEFKTAVQLMTEILTKLEKRENRSNLLETIFTAPQTIAYFQGLNEVKIVAERVLYSYDSSPSKFRALESPSLPSVPFLAEQINQRWQQLISFMKTFNRLQLLSLQGNCQPPAEELLEEKCTLCLNPLGKNDKKLLWCEKIYHSSCANFWCNRIKPTAPA